MVRTNVSWWRRGRRERPTDAVPERGYEHGGGALWTALGTVPLRQRSVLVLRYFEDLPGAEIAAVLGCSVGTVKSQASRGLSRLRAVVDGERELL